MPKRIAETKAQEIVVEHLREVFGMDDVPFELTPDGDTSWAFWVRSADTTSYMDSDGLVEWYGSGWVTILSHLREEEHLTLEAEFTDEETLTVTIAGTNLNLSVFSRADGYLLYVGDGKEAISHLSSSSDTGAAARKALVDLAAEANPVPA